jgi:hypothetical protein
LKATASGGGRLLLKACGHQDVMGKYEKSDVSPKVPRRIRFDSLMIPIIDELYDGVSGLDRRRKRLCEYGRFGRFFLAKFFV